MSFMLTTQQMIDGTKDVTRRRGWWFLKPGDVVMAVEKGMGLAKGEKIKRLFPIQIVSVSVEPLNHIDESDLSREGFPGMIAEEFVKMFVASHKGCLPGSLVNRIEFRRI